MNTRKIGDNFEKIIESKLSIKRTANSGAYWGNGDLANRKVLIEAKVKANKEGFSYNSSEVKKIMKQAEKLGLDWIYMVQDANGKAFVLCELDLFAEATEAFFNAR